MSRSERYERPPFRIEDLPSANAANADEQTNRLIFDWWCDEKDRRKYIASLNRKPTWIPTRAPLGDDPAPPLTQPAPQGFRRVLLISDSAQVHAALTRPQDFSNRPYALLGGGSFLLGQDPTPIKVDWHAEQRSFVEAALGEYPRCDLQQLAQRSVEQAALTSLARPDFDLAQFAEQATLRYLGQLFGYAFSDHPLLEEASRATYRALQYVTIGQHFVSEPLTVPLAQQALGRLVTRTSELMEEYARLERSPRKYRQSGRDWPDGVQPWSELGLCGKPLLKHLPGLPSELTGRDRATVAATMLAGTVGNIQSAVCLLTQSLLEEPKVALPCFRRISDRTTLEKKLELRLRRLPPMTVLPRRTLSADPIGLRIPVDTDCLLVLEPAYACPHDFGEAACPHAWGRVLDGAAPHACPAEPLSMPLIAALVDCVIHLPGLQSALDPLTGERLDVERLWGFGCTRYPLHFENDDFRRQHNLIVSMRVKSPVGENVARLRPLLAAAVPRIDHVLTSFGHLHFAWFEFSDDETHLVLRTIYDGDFDAYIAYFAQRAGDIFDGLFEFLESAPPRPVVEHQREFVDAIRSFNRAPLAGYLYSAYPKTGADQIRGAMKSFQAPCPPGNDKPCCDAKKDKP